MRGGGGGGGSGGGGGGGDAALLRRLRALLGAGGAGDGGDGGARNPRGSRVDPARGGGRGGGRQAGRRSDGDRARPVAAADGQQTRAEDWICGHCGFSPNFSRRRYCYDCGRPKFGGPSSPPARVPAQAGPVGAGGRKPLLAWGARSASRGEADEAPTRRTPGASVAALVEEARRTAARSASAVAGKGNGATNQKPSSSAGAAATMAMDDEGFITVGQRGRPLAAATVQGPAVGEARGSGSGSAAAASAAAAGGVGLRSMAADPAEARGGAAGRNEQREDQEAEEEEDDVPPPGPEQLRRKWAEEVAVVKHLARQGLPEGHPALAAAVAARDEAEAAWRGAKPPAPVATRLRWAQGKLTRALELAEVTRAAIAKAEDDHEQLMRQLHDRRRDDEERVKKRRLAVEELQGEIGGSPPAARAGDGGAAAVLAACGTLCNAVGPELQALVERLPDGSEEWQAANKVLATLAASQRKMEEAAGLHDERGQPEAFDIGDGAEDDFDAMSEASQWSESHELRDQGEVGGAAALGHQAPPREGAADGASGADLPQSGGDWSSWGRAHWQAPHWQADEHGRWHRASWADQWEAEYARASCWGAGQRSGAAPSARRVGGEHDEEAGEPSAKHRRQQASERAAETGGTAASARGDDAAAGDARTANMDSAAGPPPAALSGPAAFARQVDEVVHRAISLGIQPVTADGDELITLSPELLSRWVADNLEKGAGR